MSRDAPLPVVKLKLSCADGMDYLGGRAAEIALHGVFVPSDRRRELGERVRLELELKDGSRAYSGPAVVASHGRENDQAGYRLSLDVSPDEAPRDPGRVPLVTVSLAEYLFGDLGPSASTSAPSASDSGTAPHRPAPERRLRLRGAPPAGGDRARPTPVPVARLATRATGAELPARTPPPGVDRRARTPVPVPGLGPTVWRMEGGVAVLDEEPELVRLPRPDLTRAQLLGLSSGGVIAALLLLCLYLLQRHP